MADKHIRKQIILKDQKQKKLFEEFARTHNYPSFSHFCRYAMLEVIKRENDDNSKERNELLENMNIFYDSLFKKMADVGTRQELMQISIEKEGLTDDTGPALGDIALLLINRDMAYSEILAKARKYDENTIRRVLNYLGQADFAGNRIKIDKKKIEV